MNASLNRIITSAALHAPADSLRTTPYATALIELCGRIWQDLERIAELSNGQTFFDTPSELLWLAATLRLELALMLESSASARCRAMLTKNQCEPLRSMLTEVLDIIALTPDELTMHILARAQDRLLDEVLTQCAGAQIDGRVTLSAQTGCRGGELATFCV